ncbi:MAG: ATP-binding cassette domain-containing protein [Ectothiorhodospiraceae bacterium]|nr:ATP-binding cassette domain-containing protein [Ectothiorhodospiraceae bacterium]MCH8505295.1 ATP-binding cassette domain-containing protein [Ectothiorhodospiraceae bacterium]
MTTPLLEVRKLRKHYPISKGEARWLTELRAWANHTTAHITKLHAVDGVSFTIQPGESVGLVGESGCGKSTLVSLINRLIEPTDGEILFEGKDIAGMSVAEFNRDPMRGAIQVVFQDPHDSLNPRFTAFDCIAEPLRRLTEVRNGELKTRVEELATQVGLPPELLGRLPHQLSGGQKARVNIARALASRPKLLVLDEPTSALDVSVQAVILQLLDDLRRQYGISYLFVSHDLNVVRLLCDRVIVMYLGQVAESGPADQVFEQPAHPYTQALISSIPKPGDKAGEGRTRLTGEPRSPVDPDPNQCLFHGRCPRGEARCAQTQPVLKDVGPGHIAACHFAAKVDPQPAAAVEARQKA